MTVFGVQPFTPLSCESDWCFPDMGYSIEHPPNFHQTQTLGSRGPTCLTIKGSAKVRAKSGNTTQVCGSGGQHPPPSLKPECHLTIMGGPSHILLIPLEALSVTEPNRQPAGKTGGGRSQGTLGRLMTCPWAQ